MFGQFVADGVGPVNQRLDLRRTQAGFRVQDPVGTQRHAAFFDLVHQLAKFHRLPARRVGAEG